MKTIKIKAWDETKQEWVDEVVTIGRDAGNTTRLDYLEKARKEFLKWVEEESIYNHADQRINQSEILEKFHELF